MAKEKRGFKQRFKDWWQNNKINVFVTALISSVAGVFYFVGRHEGRKDKTMIHEFNIAKLTFDDYNDAICDLADKTTIAVNEGETLPELTIGDRRFNILDADEVQFWD